MSIILQRQFRQMMTGTEACEISAEDLKYYLAVYRDEARQYAHHYTAEQDDELAIKTEEFWQVLMEYETFEYDDEEHWDFEYTSETEVEKYGEDLDD